MKCLLMMVAYLMRSPSPSAILSLNLAKFLSMTATEPSTTRKMTQALKLKEDIVAVCKHVAEVLALRLFKRL